MEENLLKLLLAVLVGGLIGVEREFRTGTGLRTLMLICLGATMFTIYSSLFDISEVDRAVARGEDLPFGVVRAGQVPVIEGLVVRVVEEYASGDVPIIALPRACDGEDVDIEPGHIAALGLRVLRRYQ